MEKEKLEQRLKKIESVYIELINKYLPKSGIIDEIEQDKKEEIRKLNQELILLRKQLAMFESESEEFNTPEYQAYLKALQEKFKDEL